MTASLGRPAERAVAGIKTTTSPSNILLGLPIDQTSESEAGGERGEPVRWEIEGSDPAPARPERGKVAID